MNIIILTGRLAVTPELKETANGKIFCRFRIAVDRHKKSDGTATTDFFTCVAWGKVAEILEKWLNKGDALEIIGRIENANYELDEKKHYCDQIHVREIHFLPSGKSELKEKASDEDFAAFGKNILYCMMLQ